MKEYLEKGYVINLLEHNDKVYHYADRDKENIVYDTVQTLCRVMMEAEAADVQPVKRGKWIPKYDDKHGFHYICSNCDIISGTKLKFCFDCGARMDGEQK